MESRFKTSNIVGLLIALILIVIGFALLFIHEQREFDEKKKRINQSPTVGASSMNDNSLARTAFINVKLTVPDPDTKMKAEMSPARELIDFS